jgi:PAS domain S-box-containing protein
VADEPRDDVTAGLRRQVGLVRDLLRTLDGDVDGERLVRLDEAVHGLATAVEEVDVAMEELIDQRERLRRVQHAAEVDRERLRALFEEAPDAYVVTDRHGHVQRANRTALRLLDRPLTAAVGRPFATFFVPEHRRGLAGRIARLAAGQPLADWQARLERAGGTVPVAIDATPDPVTGTVRELRWLLRDSSERVRTQQALRAAVERTTSDRDRLQDLDAWKSAFIAAAAHDLQTPLRSIADLATTLLSRAGDDDTLHKGLLRIVDNADDLGTLLSDLLDLDRFTRGAVRLRDTWIDVAEVVRARVERTGLDVTLDLAPATVRAEPRRVDQIVANLLRNADEHTPAGTPVWVRTAPVANGATIVVEDAGPGLPTSPDRREIFAPFARAVRHEGGRTGAGIGLSLVTLFAQLHGGRAWAEDRPGGGARFTVFLPTDPADRFRAPRPVATDGPDDGDAQPRADADRS